MKPGLANALPTILVLQPHGAKASKDFGTTGRVVLAVLGRLCDVDILQQPPTPQMGPVAHAHLVL